MAAIKPPARARWSYTLKGAGFLLDDPEQYRARLVARAMEYLRGLRGVDTSRFRVTVAGLEKPLAVQAPGDQNFMVSLPYTVTVESISDRSEGATAGVNE